MSAAVRAAGLHALAAAVLGAVLVYIVARAVRVPLTYDEATTFYRHVEGAPAALLDFSTAGNHLLNSALTWGASLLFGSAPLALRLPNVVAGACYLAVVAAIARRMRQPAIGLAAVLLLATNPYLLEFFALSRGYGLAVALVTAGGWCLARWCEGSREAPAAERWLAAALGLSAAAVAASYAALVAFVAICGVVVARMAWTARSRPRPPSGRPAPLWGARAIGVWALVTVLFSVVVYSRERALVPAHPVPVTVGVAGLYEEELIDLHVFRADVTGRLREVPRSANGRWDLSAVSEAWDQLRVVLPAAADANLSTLDVTVDSDRHRRDRRNPGSWTHYDVGNQRVLRNQRDIAWRLDATHRRTAWRYGLGMSLALVMLTVALSAAGRTAVQRGIVSRGEARRLVGAVAVVGTIAAAPLHVLRRGGELFFGGAEGLLPDTLGSLVRSSAYDLDLPAGAEWVAAAVVAGWAAALALATVASGPAGRASARMPAALFAVLALTAAQIELQHHLLGTPYLIARTALFLLPLLLLAVLLTADGIAALGRPSRLVVTTLMLVAGAASAGQLMRTANLSAALDWRRDAATPRMLEALGTTRAGAPPPVIRVGVEWMFYPVVRYYAERRPEGATAL